LKTRMTLTLNERDDVDVEDQDDVDVERPG